MEQDSDIEEEEVVPQWVFNIQELPASEIKCDLNQNPVLEFTEETVVKRIYALGRMLSQVFEQFNLHYWTCGGTTLGLLRHKGLIPWDDDLDLCILEENEEKLIQDIAPILKNVHKIEVV